MGDEELYLAATEEVDSEAISPALWAKALALADGDEKKARFLYIRLRVQNLRLRANQAFEVDKSGGSEGQEANLSRRDGAEVLSLPS